MNHTYPVFTADAECQDCFKCVRQCPVKAIQVKGAHASVMPELCIACGGCVQVCPVHAKKVRDDLGRVRVLLKEGLGPVYVSLAPSWVNEFRGLPASKMIAALRQLGFAGVSETALGAQIVTEKTAELLKEQKRGLMISSACPVAVDFILKYFPKLSCTISPVLSPVLSHARFLKEQLGEKIKVVFIGPCIAKKNESDRHPDLLSMALLFSRLRQWFKEAGIDPYAMDPGPDDVFVPYASKEGALYPIEGGMNETIRMYRECSHVNFVSIGGIGALRQAFDGLDPGRIFEPVFLETLACTGGCVHGPGTEHNSPGLLERLRVLRNVKGDGKPTPMNGPEIAAEYQATPVDQRPASLNDIREALSSVGKSRLEDEINCGGCGYFTCHNFAQALIDGKAEPSMCVSYLRKLAQKKSNAILRCLPAAAVIVDRSLTVIECNKRFADFTGEQGKELYEFLPGLWGAKLEKLIPFAHLFRQVLDTGIEYQYNTLKVDGRLLDINIFNIDPKQVVGAIIFDVTKAELRREEIAERAQEVIEKNLSTVQEIACKLGEHMAETEILLRSIAEKYSDHDARRNLAQEVERAEDDDWATE
ncbi:MAG: [Fe-Fe] hydrogenase large subunit C-terminal domain-containing protein [Planctomycetia bacterium]|nr:[Fe-Fe] hydrogenase large subunit C-terminal domain-containing protein [Planctomycetia bacterium]